ncbi:MAG: hypothetical protein V1827_00785 [Candidatus Micrarchaeota archaeon]
MFTGFLGQFRSMGMKSHGEEERGPETTKAPESQKSSSPEEFLRSPETREFVNSWTDKSKDGENAYTKRGVNTLLRELYPNYGSDKAILKSADMILKMLGGKDGLTGFLAGWKAKSEGLMKGLKGILGGRY